MNKKTLKLALSGLFIALGIVLPFITMQIPSIGNMLLPMHIPVILCGFICGGPYGLLVGLIVPILRSVLVGMPVMVPGAITMAPELAVYGFLTGFLYMKLKGKPFAIYTSLISAMLVGRLVWGVVSYIVFSLLGNKFTVNLFIMNGFVNAVPGIIIQLILIPFLVYRLKKAIDFDSIR